jgi:hypothetical protein
MVWSTIWKVSLAVWPRMSLRRCGSCETRHLHQNPIIALLLDDRLGRAEFVHAPVDDLDRLADRGSETVVDALFGQGVAEETGSGSSMRQFRHGTRPEQGSEATGCVNALSAVRAASSWLSVANADLNRAIRSSERPV